MEEKTTKAKVTTKSATKVEQPIEFTKLYGDIKAKLNIVTPKNLSELFNLDQPIVRRHLRAQFQPQFEHELNDKWSMPVTLPVTKDVVRYFYDRFAVVVTNEDTSETA